MMTSVRYGYLSSSVVKEMGSLGGDIRDFVPEGVLRRIREKYPLK
jgi:pantetheine-phosphate adenylyltransferase